VCLRCGEVVKECWAWGGDVIEEKPVKVGREKKVGFVDGNGSSSESESVSEERDEEGSEVYEENEMPDFDE
jgi:hypothetical protein